ncbi:MAG: hypothetical protein QOH83_2844, partial [Solirubrobacteraceae bacterium]|nr:hypothetical protein [Solirubrobacteraceae bacterium]
MSRGKKTKSRVIRRDGAGAARTGAAPAADLAVDEPA